MKEAIIVDTNGYFIDVTLVANEETGISEIYETIEVTPATETAEYEERLIGYRVAVPVPAGLYKPRFDLQAWEAYNAPQEPAYDDEGRPVYPPKRDTSLWVEGLSQEEIDALKNQSLPETPEQKIARLESELAAAKEENLTAFTAIAELYEMVLKGGGEPV